MLKKLLLIVGCVVLGPHLIDAATPPTAPLGQSISNLLLFDFLSTDHDYYYYGHGGYDLLPLLALTGNGFFGDGESLNLQEYLLFDDTLNGHDGMDPVELYAWLAVGHQEGHDVFHTLEEIHAWDAVKHYDEHYGGRSHIYTLAAANNDPLRHRLYDLHVYQSTKEHRHNGNGADLWALNLIATGDSTHPGETAVHNLHQYHYMQEYRNNHNNLIPLGILAGGGYFNHVEPIAPFWAVDQLINGDHYHLDHHEGHGGHGGHAGGHHGGHGGGHHGGMLYGGAIAHSNGYHGGATSLYTGGHHGGTAVIYGGSHGNHRQFYG